MRTKKRNFGKKNNTKKNGGTIPPEKKKRIVKQIANKLNELNSNNISLLPIPPNPPLRTIEQNNKLINFLYISEDKNIIGFIIKQTFNYKYADLFKLINKNDMMDTDMDIFIYNDKYNINTEYPTFNDLNISTYTENQDGSIILNNNNAVLKQLYENDNFIYTQATDVINQGQNLEGGKTRAFVKSDKNIVVKSDSNYEEYFRTCFCFILQIPVNPPIGLLIGEDKKYYIIEKFINNTNNAFANCLISKRLRKNIETKFNELIRRLQRTNISGDFKFDNILFDIDGNLVLTDFAVIGRKDNNYIPISYVDWETIALSESDNIDNYIKFLPRLRYYILTNGEWENVDFMENA